MASIRARKRADGSAYYAVLFRHDGRQTSKSFTEHPRAVKFERLVETVGPAAALEIIEQNTASGDTPTLTEWFTHYLEHATGITSGTREEYRRLAARTWLPRFGALPVDAITRDAVKRWIGDQAKTLTRRQTPTSAKTIANAHGLLSHVMTAAVEDGHRADNPCRGVRLPEGQREEMCFLTESEFATLLQHIPDYWKPLVVTLAGTGMRWGEVTALQWGDFDLDASIPIVRVTRAWKRSGGGGRELGPPKTKRSRRTIDLPPEVVDILRPMRGKPDDLVFTGPQGGAVHHQAFHPRVWLRAVKAADLGKRPRIHDLRHSAASWMVADNVPLPLVQQQLGHESIQTTVDVYWHLTPGTRGLAARALSRALSPALPAIEDPPTAIES